VDLYRVTIGEDVYLGTPEEVVGFMARAEGAPRTADDPAAYMTAIAARVSERLGISGIDTSDARAFLGSLHDAGVVRVEVQGMPSDERTDPEAFLGDGPLTFGDDVDPRDVDIG
jgi:hypothetical protein